MSWNIVMPAKRPGYSVGKVSRLPLSGRSPVASTTYNSETMEVVGE
jgi:hypothetical protein